MTGRYILVEPEGPPPAHELRAAPPPTRMESFWRGAQQGGTLEFGDELANIGGTPEQLAQIRARLRAYAEANPGTYALGKFTGGTVVPMGWAFRLAKAGRGLIGATRGGAIAGGGTGAVEAIGEREGRPDDSFIDEAIDTGSRGGIGMLVGGTTGAVATPILYGLGHGVRAGGRYLYDYWRGDTRAPALRKTAQALERQDSDPRTLMQQLLADAPPFVRNSPADVIADVIRGYQAGQSATDIATAVNARHGTKLTPQQVGALRGGFDRSTAVPRDMLKLSEEVGGEPGRQGLTDMMRGVTSLPGRGREIALRNMGATMEDAPERLRGRIGAALGDQRFVANRKGLEEARQAEAAEVYGLARANQGEFDLTSIGVGEHLRAQAIGGEAGSRLGQAVHIMTGLDPTKPAGKMPVNTLERYHEARKSLDRLVEDMKKGSNPDWNAIRLIRNYRRALNNEVYRNNPMMQAADQRFDTAMAREEALDLGRGYSLKSGQHQDDILKQLRDIEAHDPGNAREFRQWFMQGVSRRIADDIENAGGIPSSWTQPLTGGIRAAPHRALVEAMSAPLPGAPVAKRSDARTGAVRGQPIPTAEGREAAHTAVGALDDEARLRKIFTDVWGNSNTAGKLQAVEDLRELPRIASELATGGFTGVRNAIAQRLLNAMTERNAEHVARIVTETDPRLLYLALHEINRMAPMLRFGERAISAPAVGVGSATGQTLTGK